MSDLNQNIAAPTVPEGETQAIEKPRRARRWPFIILGIFLLLIGGGAGGWLGYQQAVQARVEKAQNEIAVAAAAQYELALVDYKDGRFEMARQRLEYIIGINPNFPNVRDKLAEVLAAEMLALTPTITPTPTPTPVTPTPDLRGVEAQYNSILDLMRNKDWDGAINAIEALRQADLTYRAVDADGLYYICLRYRGLQKILVEGNLEGGTYDLALSSRFGPLDKDADSYRIWARMYITGASFWKVNWDKVIEYFSQVAPAFPNMRDGSGMTATERLRQAYFESGKELLLKEQSCDAVKMFENSLALAPNDQVTSYYNQAFEKCGAGAPSDGGGSSQPGATETPTPTPTPTGMITVEPSITPTVEASPTP